MGEATLARSLSRCLELGELVGHRDRGCLWPRVEDLLAKRGLAVPVLVDGAVLSERLDQPRDLRAESAQQLVGSDVRVFEQVMRQAGHDDRGGVAFDASSPATAMGCATVLPGRRNRVP